VIVYFIVFLAIVVYIRPLFLRFFLRDILDLGLYSHRIITQN